MRAVGIAIALAALGCGRAEKKEQPEPVRPPAIEPKQFQRPSRVPTFVTLDELRAAHPALTGVRPAAELALETSGKQGLASVCIAGTDAAAAAKAIADQYAAAQWKGPPPDKAAFAADREVADGALHVQGQVRTLPACGAGELTVELRYTKLVPLASGAQPGVATDRVPPPAPPR